MVRNVASPQDFEQWIAAFDPVELARHGWTGSALLDTTLKYSYWVIYSGSHIAAGLFYQELGPQHFEVIFLGTAPHERRKGHLSQLFLHFFKAHGPLRLWLECREDNHAARALYAQHGFRETGRRRHYYSDGRDAILMEFSQNMPA